LYNKFSRKSFPSPDRFYYIKTQAGSQDGQFRYLEGLGYLSLSADDRSKFQFTKNSDGTFNIYAITKVFVKPGTF
jgi:hypothetical protein